MIQDPEQRPTQHPLARAGEVILFWIPVVVPLVLLAQLGTNGLRPALHDAKQLDADARALEEEILLSEEQRQYLEKSIIAQRDPIFRRRAHNRLLQSAGTSLPQSTPTRKR
jgi:hypothetical protein